MLEKESTRLNKYISESGLCSRREADEYIQLGTVFINGRKASVGDRVFTGDKVVVNGYTIEAKQRKTTIILAYNKPVGVVSTTDPEEKENLLKHVIHSERIFPIGRLDKDSQGLLLLTNNGDIVNKILRAENNHDKEYLVTVDKPITDSFISGMTKGVPILGQVTKKCIVKKENTFAFKITLVQGLNRQIRRMCEYFGYNVTKLERIRIMNIHLKGIQGGDYREITEDEFKTLSKLTENSTGTSATGTKSKPSTKRHILAKQNQHTKSKSHRSNRRRNEPRKKFSK
ncbi:MAG TPA: 23S rRNA pseudouridine(2604) synthase RluF [Leptospiraceae bacterium]|nr:23S rRNA pseudouridine(2604) synthase RluF [Leptospiraceae bacterium]HMX33423.1 23S rRNA pseudouridine(2604) synthase RluF [Leptospiraceae bacterium]HMY32795.1 23S rRNA pseudouridine(2604) synthase RluF [Leptospiraceae bacterium]HNA08134.1 23S rRNA pseudouridine(2604) synthase RluF [Leptospiraceae bacterium]HNE54782.1 23S rRNA pseudouridine(2604) synthase RluF [Leptospiraceae bacterium]